MRLSVAKARPVLLLPRMLGAYISGYSYNVGSRITDSNWSDANLSGIYFMGIADSGATLKLPLYSANAGPTSAGFIDATHTAANYGSFHPTWNTLEEVDRAFFRGMGYVVVPEPTSSLLGALGGLLLFARRRARTGFPA